MPIEGASSFRNKSKVINGAEHVTAKVGRDFNETKKQLLRINIWDVFEKITLTHLKEDLPDFAFSVSISRMELLDQINLILLQESKLNSGP